MASYTIELRKVCDLYGRDEVENWFKSYNLSDFLTEEQISQITKYNVWSKEKLAKKIVDHYYMREIGLETPALFSHYAKVTMNEIMEEYLLKIYTKFLEYDPLSSVDYEEKYTREINQENKENGTSSNSSNSQNSLSSSNISQNSSTSSNTSESSGSSSSSSDNNGSGLTVSSDTPQGQINKSNILNGSYASNVNASETETSITSETETSNNASSEIETSGTSSSNTSESSNSSENSNEINSRNGTSKTLETYTHTMKGDNGVIVTNQYLIREFRELAINFDLEIIEKLNTLFMGIY